MSAIIEINNLSKRYGKRMAVNKLSLSVQEGDIFGFVGPNGAGKTSTIRIMTTLLQPESGDILIDGHSVNDAPEKVRREIGYMPDFFGIYDDMLLWEYLDFFGACYQIPEKERAILIDELLELVDLSHRKQDAVDKLSRGMKQRLSLARTLINDPKVLILDEPASGLDPRARSEIRELLRELATMGKTVFFSTHILEDVAEICTRVGIIEAGQLVAYGSIEELQQQLLPTRKIEITILGKAEEAEKILQQVAGIQAINIEETNGQKHMLLTCELSGTDEEVSKLLAQLIHENIPVIHFTEDIRNIESVFLEATQGIVT